MSSVTRQPPPSSPDVGREWLYVGLGLTALVSVMAMVVALVAWSQSPSSESMGANAAPMKAGSMMSPAAAGGAAGTATTLAKQTASGSVVGVTMGEMFLHLTANTAQAGKVTFNAVNSGSVMHEMVVIRTDKPADKLGTGSRVPETGAIGETGDVKVGEKKSVSFNMTPGHYALICNLPGHYAGGMRADFTVVEKSGAAAATAPAPAAASSVINAQLGEMFIHLSGNTAPAGKVTFNADNTGSVMHEMVVIRTDKAAGKLGSGARVPETGAIGETGDVKVGEKKSVSFKMKPGHYALICNLPGHYAGGMWADFTVK